MTNHNRFRTAPRSPDSRPDRPQSSKATGKSRTASTTNIDLALYVLLAAIAIVLGALAVRVWMTYNSAPVLAIHRPALTPTPVATATATTTPTATPTPNAAARAAAQIPLLQQSWDARDWQAAAEHLNQIASLDDNYPGLQQARCDTYLHWAEDMERQCQIHRAYVLYRQASSLCQDRDAVLDKKSLALRYLSGKWRYDHSLWSQAAAVLHTVYESDPNYAAGCTESLETDHSSLALRAIDVRSLLYTAYVASSQEFLDQERTQDALKAAQAALGLVPESHRAGKLLAKAASRIAAKAAEAAARSKRIEVSISKQRMYVWQGERLIYEWVCSTGGSGSGTATGRYKVQSKIPEAWASQWSLRMPYWLGIYHVGPIENGIHALPILSNGNTLWAGYLGTPVSYGCIILSTENARTLYQWADMGTAVWIHY